jgi:hypothetical protein
LTRRRFIECSADTSRLNAQLIVSSLKHQGNLVHKEKEMRILNIATKSKRVYTDTFQNRDKGAR